MKRAGLVLLAVLTAFALPSLRAQAPAPTATPFERLQLDDPTATPTPALAPESVSSLAPETKLSPRAQPLLAPVFSASNQTLGTAQLVLYFLVLAALVAGGFYLIRRGLPLRASRKAEQQLQVLETKMLGNRQFLLVVAYQDTRMLLGVSPGQIQYLAQLDVELPETAELINLATTPRSKIGGEPEV